MAALAAPKMEKVLPRAVLLPENALCIFEISDSFLGMELFLCADPFIVDLERKLTAMVKWKAHFLFTLLNLMTGLGGI